MSEHLASVFEAYHTSSKSQMKWRRPVDRPDAVEPASSHPRKLRKATSCGSDSDSDGEVDVKLQHRLGPLISAPILSEQALWWVELLTAYMGKDRLPHQDHMDLLQLLIRQHAVHEDQRPSQAAFRLLQLCVLRFPTTTLDVYPPGHVYEGIPFVTENKLTFTCLQEWKRPSWEKSLPAPGSTMLPSETWRACEFFLMLWQRAAALTADGNADDDSWVQSHYGDVLLLTVMVQQLGAELAPRLAAHRATGGEATLERIGALSKGSKQTLRRSAWVAQREKLLNESHLWRIMVGMATGPTGEVVRQVVRLLLAIIGGGAAGCIANDAPCGGRLITAQESLRGTASALLRLLLSLFGSMEAAGHWKSAGQNRRGDNDVNLRTEMDQLMVEAMSAASSATLQRPEAKQALLAVLQPHDAIRLLGLVVGNKRPEKPQFKEKYKSMDAGCEVALSTGVTGSFITIDPADVFQFLSDDLDYIQRSRRGQCPAEDLALFAARLASASAAADLPNLEELLVLYDGLSQQMLIRHKYEEAELTAEAIAELRGSLRVLQAAVEHR